MSEKPLTIITMVFDIGRYHPFILRKAFDLFYNSLALHHSDFKLIVYTNLPAQWWQKGGVEVHHEEEKDFSVLYPDIRWFNLTFHRYFLLKKHMEAGEDVIWIDLDTVICGDLGFTQKLPNFFIKHGFGENLVTLNSKTVLAQKEWLHGHAHKMDLNIVKLVDNLLEKEKNDLPTYELMSVFSLLRLRHPGNFLLLNDYTDKHINLEWCYDASIKPHKVNSLTAEHSHPEPHFIKDRIEMINGQLCGYDGREFLLMTFTFPALEMNLRENWKNIGNPQARAYLRSLCRITPLDQLKFKLLRLRKAFTKDHLKRWPMIGTLIRRLRPLIHNS